MSNGLPAGQGPDGKFLRGNALGRGGAVPRAIQMFRAQVVRELRMGRSVPRLVRKLKTMAFAGSRPVRLRKKDPETGKVTRETVWMPVTDSTQLAAIMELLSRAIGKSTQFKVVQNQDATPRPTYSLDQMVVALETLGVPEERWPPMLREHRRRRVESKVTEPPPRSQ
jgi:hypothetical protein